jgi:hypothetical protein
MHKSYEELCALAVTGQITGDAMKVLDQHIKDCSNCRAFLEDLVSLKAHVTPVVAGSRMQSRTPPDGIRERFLQRAAGAGLELRPGPPMEIPADLEALARPERSAVFETAHAARNRIVDWYDALPRFGAPVTVGVLCAVLGFLFAQHRVGNTLGRPVIAQVSAPVAPTAPPDGSPASAQLANLRKQNADVQKHLVALSNDLARTQLEKRQLEQELSRLAQRAAAGEQFEEQFTKASAALQEADARAGRLQADLEAERSNAATADAVSLAQQKVTEDAHTTIANLQAQLDRVRELDSGKSMAGDLISARNLHIVDVYDTESNGERKHAFGRVFFVEGKSLVFYAYDLPGSRRENKKVEFQVWGEQAGLNSVSLNLGAMRSDNSGQGRWVLTCDDPKVLNRINAVYITADQNPRHDFQPRGAKLMYAFLGSPNHP